MSNDNTQENISQAAELTEKEKGFQETIKSLQSKVVKNEIETLCSYIAIGKELLKIKIELKNRFYLAITDGIMQKKQVQRYLKLVLNTDKKDNTLSKLMSDINKLKAQEDKRVTDLTVDTISDKCQVLSINKLTIAKELSESDFKKVMLDGISKPFNDLAEKKKKATEKASDKSIEDHYEKVKDVMDKDTHKNYYNDVQLAINDLAKEKQTSKELSDEIERLQEQAKALSEELQELATSTDALYKAGVISNSLVDMRGLTDKLYVVKERTGTEVIF